MNKKFLVFLTIAFTMLFALSAAAKTSSNVEQKHFPVIKIVSTENGGSNSFVKDPVAAHVKEAQRSWGDFSKAGKPDPFYEKCLISVDGQKEASGQVKVRGNWTTNYDKKSLRIKLDDKQNLLGLNNGKKYKNWVLLACYKDASLMRDAAGLTLFRTMFPDYYASDFAFVEVEVNGENLGIYLLVEQQETKEGRIDIKESDKKDPKTNIGYLLEFDSYYHTEAKNEQFEIDYNASLKDYFGTKARGLQSGYTIKSDIHTKEQHDFIADYMNKLWKICYQAAYKNKYYRFTDTYELEEYTPAGSSDDAKAKNCIEQVIDTKSLANIYILNELICDPDLYLTSFFMDIDFSEGKDHRLRFEAPWDFDSTMGNKRFNGLGNDNANGAPSDMFAGKCQPDVNGSFADGPHGNPWMLVFIKSAWFQKLVKEQWKAAKKTNPLQAAIAVIEKYNVPEYQDIYLYNRSKWGIGQNGAADELNEQSLKAALSSQADSAVYLSNWLTRRFKDVDNIIKSLK